MINKRGNIVNILWTGGWDSTFRLLQLVLIHKKKVQPFYLIDSDRASTGIEIKTMKDIKNVLFKEYPYTTELILPTRFIEVNDLKPDVIINEAYQSILHKSFIGEQYEWLARFCRQHNITDIELCVHLDDKAHKVVMPFIVKDMQKGIETYKYNNKNFDGAEKALFQYFSFPILDLSKVEMNKISKENHWEHIMNMTWFCHKPKKGKFPCGDCNPCIYTIDEGLGWRITLYNRVSGRISRKIIKPIKKVFKR